MFKFFLVLSTILNKLYRTTFACTQELKGLVVALRQREAACQVAKVSCEEEASLPPAAAWALLALCLVGVLMTCGRLIWIRRQGEDIFPLDLYVF